MKTIVHKANTRGHANHGWLDSYHSFSFANYYNPERMGFGLLRVLNDDVVAGGGGFGAHPHDNMEIVSIPLKGDLEHRDSMGNVQVIRSGDVQIMSAGTGIYHSEYNKNAQEPVNFLQIWVFPKERNIEPRYDQKTYDPAGRVNKWQIVVAPDNEDAVWINQNAWFSLAKIESGKSIDYNLNDKSNGIYLFVLEGSIVAAGNLLEKRDALAAIETEVISLEAKENADVLVIEVPLS